MITLALTIWVMLTLPFASRNGASFLLRVQGYKATDRTVLRTRLNAVLFLAALTSGTLLLTNKGVKSGDIYCFAIFAAAGLLYQVIGWKLGPFERANNSRK